MVYCSVMMSIVTLFLVLLSFYQVSASVDQGYEGNWPEARALLKRIHEGIEDCKRTREMLLAIDLGPAGNARMAKLDKFLSECFPESTWRMKPVLQETPGLKGLSKYTIEHTIMQASQLNLAYLLSKRRALANFCKNGLDPEWIPGELLRKPVVITNLDAPEAEPTSTTRHADVSGGAQTKPDWTLKSEEVVAQGKTAPVREVSVSSSTQPKPDWTPKSEEVVARKTAPVRSDSVAYSVLAKSIKALRMRPLPKHVGAYFDQGCGVQTKAAKIIEGYVQAEAAQLIQAETRTDASKHYRAINVLVWILDVLKTYKSLLTEADARRMSTGAGLGAVVTAKSLRSHLYDSVSGDLEKVIQRKKFFKP